MYAFPRKAWEQEKRALLLNATNLAPNPAKAALPFARYRSIE